MSIAQEINYLPQIRNCNQSLAKLYEKIGKVGIAYQYYKKYISVRDSLFNLDKVKTIAEIENRNELEQKQTEYKLLTQQKELADATLKKQLTFIYSLIIVGVLMVLLALLAYNRYLIKRNANTLLLTQNIEIQRQQGEILASINYAKNIQNAILPPPELLQNYVPEYFILYLPKDIVSGDFYWMHTTVDELVIAAVDCTGHGVPGGFLSMLGTAILNDIVHNNNHLYASEILDLLNSNIINLLHQNREDMKTKDGMDIALCKYTLSDQILQYAGAHNPLYLIRNNELSIYKADRIPIGIYSITDKKFTNHKIKTQKNDQVYIFSDGYTDQFGGENDQKFKNNQFKAKLLEISNLPMEAQKSILYETFQNWKGTCEQIDDILVIGLKF